ncbi:MAG: HesB/IscA family protein [Oligoflexus sp.]
MSENESIRLNSLALEKAQELSRDFRQYQGKSLRLYLDGKGCDGFYYGVAFDTPNDNDLHFPQSDIDLIIDPDSFEFCAGSTITWVDDERGQGFLVENPNHRKFRGKFYKRKVWQEKLEEKRQTPST